MKYIAILSVLILAAAAHAEDGKKSAQQKVWTEEYQYGSKEKQPETGKPAEGGEFEIAPRK